MSERAALHFTGLELRRVPGIRGAFTIDGLIDGVNVIYGPNASGKSTAAELIQALLWPTVASSRWARAAYVGQYVLAGARWRVEVDAGPPIAQRDGSRVDLALQVAPDQRSRYLLTLHDLLKAEERNEVFAQAIRREAAGGYDLDGAIASLGYSDARPRAGALDRAAEAARRAVLDATNAQAQLQQSERELDALREQRDAARSASTRLDLLRRAQEYAARREALASAERALAVYPTAMANLRGDESTTLEGLRARRDAINERLRDARSRLDAATEALHASGIAPADVPDDLLDTLERLVQELQEQQSTHRRLEEAAHQLDAARQHARRGIFADADEPALASVDPASIEALEQITWQLEAARAEERAMASLIRALGDPGQPEPAGSLHEAIVALRDWLRSEPAAHPASNRVVWGLIAGGLLVIAESIALGVVVHPLFYAAGVLGVLLLAQARQRPVDRQLDRRAAIERDFERLNVGSPAGWTADEVEKYFDTLVARYVTARDAARTAQSRSSYDAERRILEEARVDLEQALADASAGLRRVPESAVLLHSVAQSLAAWQAAERQHQAAQAEQAAVASRGATILRQINDRVEPFAVQPATDHATAYGVVEALKRRVQTARDAARAIDAADTSIRELEQDEAAVEGEIATLFARADLTAGDEHTLTGWLDALPTYREAVARQQRAHNALDDAAARLEEHPDLLTITPDDLASDIAKTAELADRYDALSARITRIETQVEAAKQTSDLATALAERARAHEALAEARERDYARAAGWELSQFIGSRTRDSDLPDVFFRAREIFTATTRGHFRLELERQDGGRFGATDTVLDRPLALDELSAATRLQLLVAVRVAFVEVNERGPKLPLLLDEALGNSDEQRAEALIQAAAQIARDGRQVFYFTAQQDEVAKWQAVLAQHPDVPHQVLDLGEIRGLADAARMPLPAASVTTPRVPAPASLDRHAYAQALNVPAVDPWAALGAVHLWHLVPDVEALHALLAFGVTHWGHLATMLDVGVALPGPARAMRQAIQDRAEVLVALLAAWRVGRGRPVDREVLLESGAITPTFIDRVSDLAAALDGDAQRLIAGLAAGDVPYFRQDTAGENLQQYLSEQGYLDERERLDLDGLRRAAASTPPVVAGRLTSDEVDDLLTGLGLSI